jgi:phage gp36-like protein
MALLYTTVDQVKSLFRKIKIEAKTLVEANNTAVTTEDVEAFITEAEIEINSRIANYYILPAGTNSKILLGKIAKYKAAQVIKNILSLTQTNSDTVKQETYSWDKMANDLLNQIAPLNKSKPITPLPDTALLAEPPTGASLFSSATNVAVFKKNEANW